MKRSILTTWLALCVSIGCVASVAAQQDQNQASGGDRTDQQQAEQQSQRQRQNGGDDGEGGGRRERLFNEATFLLGEKNVSIISSKLLKTDGPDFAQIENAKSGDVVQLTVSAAPKLSTKADLRFGDVVVKTENVAENYPGVYGLWLKKTDSGWNLVFNEKADVWGTMYDPEANAAEIPLQYSRSETDAELLTFEFSGETSGGALRIAWGPHIWTAKFAPAP